MQRKIILTKNCLLTKYGKCASIGLVRSKQVQKVTNTMTQDDKNRINSELKKEWLKLANENESGWFYSVRYTDRDGVVIHAKRLWVTDLY